MSKNSSHKIHFNATDFMVVYIGNTLDGTTRPASSTAMTLYREGMPVFRLYT
jgi:hypothetical protein